MQQLKRFLLQAQLGFQDEDERKFEAGYCRGLARQEMGVDRVILLTNSYLLAQGQYNFILFHRPGEETVLDIGLWFS